MTLPGKSQKGYCRPLLTDEQILEEKKKNVETEIVRIICSEFGIPIYEVYQSSSSLTGGDESLTIGGLNRITNTNFPAEIRYISSQNGKGKAFTLNRLLKNPMSYPLFSEFHSAICNEKHKKPLLMLGLHPRVESLIAITNLPLEVDYHCYQTKFEPPIEQKEYRIQDVGKQKSGNAVGQVVTFGESKYVLRAMRRQKRWEP